MHPPRRRTPLPYPPLCRSKRLVQLAFSPDGQRLASGSRDSTVKVWEVATGKEVFTLRGHTEPVFSVAFSPNGRRLASSSYDRTVKLWDARTGHLAPTLQRFKGQFGR